jgi:PAS domain S-box-containing protein
MIMPENLRLILLMASKEMQKKITEVFEKSGYSVFIQAIQAKRDFVTQLKSEKPWSAVIGDYLHPYIPAFEAIEIIKENTPDLPYFVVAEKLETETARAMLQSGAADFILHQNINRILISYEREQKERDLKKAVIDLSKQLEESQNKYQSIFRKAHQVMMVVDVETGRLIDVNNYACKFYGFLYEEFVKMYVWDLNTLPEEKMLQILSNFKEGKIESVKVFHRTKNKEQIYVKVTASAINTIQGVQLLVIVNDISEQQIADNEVQAYKTQLHSILNYHHQGTSMLDINGRFLDANQAMLAMIGLKHEQLPDFEFYESPCWSHSQDIKIQIQNAVKRALSGEFVRAETFLLLPSMEIKKINLLLTPIRNVEGEIVHLVATLLDTVVSNKTVHEIQGSRSVLRSAVDNFPFDLWITDEDGNITFQNSHLIAKTVNQAGKIESERLIIKDLKESWSDIHNRVVKGEKIKREVSERTLTGEKYYQQIIQPFIINENLIGSMGLNWDISDYYKTIEELKKSRDRLQIIMESSEDVVWDYNMGRDEIYGGMRMYSMLGFEPGEIESNLQFFINLFHPDDIESVMNIISERLLKTDSSFELLFRVRHKSGKYIWVETKGKVIGRNADGIPLRVVGTSRDITNKMEAELELKKSEEKFHQLFLQNPEPLFLWRKCENDFLLDSYNEAGFTFTSGAIEKLIGISYQVFWADYPDLIGDFERSFSGKITVCRTINYIFKLINKTESMIVTCNYISPDFLLVRASGISKASKK